VLTQSYRWRGPTYDSCDLQQLFAIINEFLELAHTATAGMTEFFPVLRSFPDFLLPVQGAAKRLHKREKVIYLMHWMNAKRDVQAGIARPCFSVQLAKEQEAQGFSDDLACYITGTLLEAGSHTTAGTLYGFIQAMLLFPEVPASAQAEIDTVVGSDRMADMDDEFDLQYIRGCTKESLRWMPTTLLGAVPHATIQEDQYLGYRSPKGASIVNNVYTIHNDAARYPEPRRFNPSHYSNDKQSAFDAAINADVTQRDHFTFGAGRRICPGMHIAERSLYLAIARILWAFDIRPAKDLQGNDILPDPHQLTQGFACEPLEYNADIRPRSQARAEAVLREWKEAESSLLDPETKQWKKIPPGMALAEVKV
jgi:cytochrome P450